MELEIIKGALYWVWDQYCEGHWPTEEEFEAKLDKMRQRT